MFLFILNCLIFLWICNKFLTQSLYKLFIDAGSRNVFLYLPTHFSTTVYKLTNWSKCFKFDNVQSMLLVENCELKIFPELMCGKIFSYAFFSNLDFILWSIIYFQLVFGYIWVSPYMDIHFFIFCCWGFYFSINLRHYAYQQNYVCVFFKTPHKCLAWLHGAPHWLL